MKEIHKGCENTDKHAPAKRPVAQRRVIVITRTFRCLGYLDEDGQWRDDARNNVIPCVTGWIPLDDFGDKKLPQ